MAGAPQTAFGVPASAPSTPWSGPKGPEPWFPVTCPGPRLRGEVAVLRRGLRCAAGRVGSWWSGPSPRGGRLLVGGSQRRDRSIREELGRGEREGGRGGDWPRRPAALPSSCGDPLPAGCSPLSLEDASRRVRSQHHPVTLTHVSIWAGARGPQPALGLKQNPLSERRCCCRVPSGSRTGVGPPHSASPPQRFPRGPGEGRLT